jgi:hypothetical protein
MKVAATGATKAFDARGCVTEIIAATPGSRRQFRSHDGSEYLDNNFGKRVSELAAWQR